MNKNYFEIARKNMVTNQVLPVGVKNNSLIESLYSTKRELFITGNEKDLIYSDSDIKFSEDRNFIRTFLLAKMFEECNFSKEKNFSNWMSYWILSCNSINLVGYVFAMKMIKTVN